MTKEIERDMFAAAMKPIVVSPSMDDGRTIAQLLTSWANEGLPYERTLERACFLLGNILGMADARKDKDFDLFLADACKLVCGVAKKAGDAWNTPLRDREKLGKTIEINNP